VRPANADAAAAPIDPARRDGRGNFRCESRFTGRPIVRGAGLALLIVSAAILIPAAVLASDVTPRRLEEPRVQDLSSVDVTPPTVHVDAPTGDATLFRGEPVDIRWTSSDDRGVVSADIYLSLNGAAGPYAPVVLGTPDTGSYRWLVQGFKSEQATFKVVVRDAGGNTAADLSHAPLAIRDDAPLRVVSLRADSADGLAPGTNGNISQPWHDSAGGHDAVLWNFHGTPASGWKGDGSHASPYRLQFGNGDQGADNRAMIPAGSVPELQGLVPLTTEVWFKTGFDGASDRYEYILEWVEQPVDATNPDQEGRGMSIMVRDGMLQVYANPWIEAAPVSPDTWYHVAVTKDLDQIRVYLDGQRVYTGSNSHMGIQQSPIVVGCSTFRMFEGYSGSAIYGEPFRGAISRLAIWRGVLDDAAVLASFRTDSSSYLPSPPAPAATMIASFRADSASGSGPYSSPAAPSSWADLVGSHPAALAGFDGSAGSGWAGDGTSGSPYRLEFDGVDDHVTIPPASIPQLQSVSAVTAEAWIRTGADVASDRYQYVLEWIEGFGSSSGMSAAISSGKLQVYLATPYWTEVAAVAPNTWYHIAITKEPGQVRVYLNGNRVFSSVTPNLGDQTSEIVWGASTWRGIGQYGDFFQGAMKDLTIWQGALDDHLVQTRYASESTPGTFEVTPAKATETSFALDGPRPNPARSLRVSFALPSGTPARLEVFDVTGRRMRAVEVGTLGAGRHVLDLGAGAPVPAGQYVVRLAQGGRKLCTKVTVVH
jgi:hypothetical protein